MGARKTPLVPLIANNVARPTIIAIGRNEMITRRLKLASTDAISGDSSQ
jgi:hypothetical protein